MINTSTNNNSTNHHIIIISSIIIIIMCSLINQLQIDDPAREDVKRAVAYVMPVVVVVVVVVVQRFGELFGLEGTEGGPEEWGS